MDSQDVDELVALADERLGPADAALARDYPGDRGTWQPVSTVYVPADQFAEHTPREYGDAALGLLERNEELFREVTGIDDATLALVIDKLRRQPIEDLRVDFEDGYGARADADEDADARAAGATFRALRGQDDAPGRTGIRFKSLEAATRRRGLRTLVLVLDGMGDPYGDDDFVVTLPKVTSVEQVETLAAVLEAIEKRLVWGARSQPFEIQVETPQTILGADGTALLSRMIRAAHGRCVGLHYGTYDYSAFLGIAAADQSLAHPAADHAKVVMQAAAAGTGVHLSDGSTNVLPVGDRLSDGWALHHRLVTRSLHRGFYQGWDLHPAQLPTRYAATFQFFRAGAAEASDRLAAYAGQARPADAAGAVADEPATVRALADFLVRGLNCGALTDDEVAQPRDELRRLARRVDAERSE